MARFLMVLCSHGISGIVPGTLLQTPFAAPLSFTLQWKAVLKDRAVVLWTLWSSNYTPEPKGIATITASGSELLEQHLPKPQMTILCGTEAAFTDIALHPATEAFKRILRHVKRWPNFCEVLSPGRFPQRANENF